MGGATRKEAGEGHFSPVFTQQEAKVSSPETEEHLLNEGAEPRAVGSGGGVDKPHREEGLHVTSSACRQTD